LITVARAAGREILTAAGVRADCRRVAGGLHRQGVRHGDVVLLFLSHQAGLIPAFLGCQWIGAIPSFMPALSPRQDPEVWLSSHRALIDHVSPAAIIADPEVRDLLADGRLPVLSLADLEAGEVGGDDHPVAYDPDGICVLQHSSGTTGLKKGVALSYRAVLTQIESYGAALELTGGETVVSWLPVYHDMGLVACTVLPTVRGLPLVSMDPFEWLVQPTRVLEEAAEAQDALVWLPNFAFNHLARHARRLKPDTGLGGIRALINCSEPCRPESFDLMLGAYGDRGLRPAQLQTCYAMAETVFAVSQSRLGAPVRRRRAPGPGRSPELLSCGRPLAGLAISVRDEDGREVDDGEIGQIHVRGPSLFDGYFRQAELTKTRLSDGWYATRDIGFVEDGEVFISGRLDDVIIVAGRNLYAHDIEAWLANIAGLKPGRAVAFGIRNDQTGTEDLVILAEAERGGDDTLAGPIAERVRERLAQVLLVSAREVVVLNPDTLIKTTSGKISRNENRRRYQLDELKSWRATP